MLQSMKSGFARLHAHLDALDTYLGYIVMTKMAGKGLPNKETVAGCHEYYCSAVQRPPS